MTKQLTRQEVEGLIERLDPHANKCDYCKYDGKVTPFCEYCGCEYPRGVTIRHVLSKIDKKVGGRNYYIGQTTYNEELIHLWSRCGEITQSLQETIEESGYHIVKTSECEDPNCRATDSCFSIRNSSLVLTSPEANALFSFLQEII